MNLPPGHGEEIEVFLRSLKKFKKKKIRQIENKNVWLRRAKQQRGGIGKMEKKSNKNYWTAQSSWQGRHAEEELK